MDIQSSAQAAVPGGVDRAEDGAVSQGSGGLDPEQFRVYGKQVIDWIADYLANAERYPVLSPLNPGDVKRRLPAEPPQMPESMDAILADFDRVILPGVTHWDHPGFFAWRRARVHPAHPVAFDGPQAMVFDHGCRRA